MSQSPESKSSSKAGSSGKDTPATLIECLLRHVDEQPEEVALWELGTRGKRICLTWAELGQAAQGLARHLLANYPNHVVLVALPNCAQAQVALLGSLWSGARTFPISPLTPASGFASQVDKLGKCILICGERQANDLEGIFAATLTSEAIAASEFASSEECPDESLHSSVLLQSSGTTGYPKLVCREMPSLLAVGRNLVDVLELCPADRMLVTISLCHSYGIDLALMAATIAGSEIELHPQYSPTTTRSSLDEGKITVWPGVPLMFDTSSRGTAGPISHQLRLAISAGSPMPVRVYDQFVAAFNIPIGQIYGTSEFGSVFYNSPSIFPFDPAAVGRPLEGVEARIISLERPDIDEPMKSGQAGEVAIRAPSMMTQYLDAQEGPDGQGFLRTGDIGSVDERGVLRLSGRVKLLIDVGAQKVNPLEVEAIIALHPSVSESVVVALPYSDTADRLKAIVLAREGKSVDIAELRAHLREHLIAYKIPRVIEVRKELPRSPSAKILRGLLQAEAAKGSP
ncbi:MAG TPA: long-chain fatty acid--CoA ligase [Myxococcales bacterium]|nr:long-chain fatty acid--CoA ligase [Myxococcales bacterium]